MEDEFDLFIEPCGVDESKAKAWQDREAKELADRRYLEPSFTIIITQADLKIPYNGEFDNIINHAVIRNINKFNLEFDCTRACLISNSTENEVSFIGLYFDNNPWSWCKNKDGNPTIGNSRCFSYKSEYFFPKFFEKDLIKRIKNDWTFKINFCSKAKGEDLKLQLRIK